MIRPASLLFLVILLLAVSPPSIPAADTSHAGPRQVTLSLNTHGPSLAVGVSEANGIAGLEISLQFTPGGFLAVPRPASPSPEARSFEITTDTESLTVTGIAEQPLARAGFAWLVTVPLEIRRELREPVRVEIVKVRLSDEGGVPLPALAGPGLNIHPSQVNYRVGESQAVTHSESHPDNASRLRIMSFNIRYDNPGDGPNAWPHRKDIAGSMIRFHRADSAGLQEAQRHQVDDLAQRLPEYAWFGDGRDDGEDSGEFMAIFYRKDRLKLLEEDTFWLAETPDVPGSVSWESSCPRTVTWGKFRNRVTGKTFFHFNTHFDNHSAEARRMSAKLLVRKIAGIAVDSPVVLTGDFNCSESSPPYGILTNGDGNQEHALLDAMKVSIHGHHGPTGTFSGFERPGTPGHRIDFIFVGNGIRVLQHGILSDTFDGRFPSDHLPVLAEISIN